MLSWLVSTLSVFSLEFSLFPQPFLLTYKYPADIIKSMSAKTVQAQKCFVCGSENPRGLKVPFIFEDDKVRAEFTPDGDLCGFDGIVHAGILFALADEAMMHLIHGNQVKAITSEVTLRLKHFATNCTAKGKFLYYTDNHPFKKSGL